MSEFDKYINNNNQGGFEVPQDYFKQLRKKLVNSISMVEPNFGSENGFTVPDGYFENLNQNILKSIPSKQAKKISLFKQQEAWFAAIAAVFIAVVLLFLYKSYQKPLYSHQMLQKVSDEEIMNHLTNTGYTYYMLCDAGWCNEIKDKKTGNLDNYILENIDESILLEEL